MFLVFVLIFVAGVSGVWKCPSDKSGTQLGKAPIARPALTPLGCGTAITPPTSLRHPESGEYKNNEHCRWVITAPQGQRVKAVFTAISIHHFQDGCGDDYLEISTTFGTSAGKYCEDVKPSLNITVADNVMGLTFRSDDYGKNGLGFSVEFLAVPVTEPANVTTCGGQLLTGDSIQFPQGDCTYTVTAPEGKLIDARFSGLTNSNVFCGDYYIRISPLSGATLDFCGTYTYAYGADPLQRLISSDRTMKIEQHMPYQYFKGLSANFSEINQDSVMVQYFANFWIVDTPVTLNQPNWVYVTSNGTRGISMVDGAVAQMIHEAGSGPVNITVKAGTYSGQHSRFEVSFMSEPTQSWVIRTDGVFKQDGSNDLTKFKSIRPDHPWSSSG